MAAVANQWPAVISTWASAEITWPLTSTTSSRELADAHVAPRGQPQPADLERLVPDHEEGTVPLHEDNTRKQGPG